MCFLTSFLSGWSVHWWKWGIKAPHYYCIAVDSSLYVFQYLPYILRWSYIGCIYIYNCYIFFLDWTFDNYVKSFFVSYNTLCFKVYFVWYEYCYSSFLMISICVKYLLQYLLQYYLYPLNFSLSVPLGMK